MAHPRTRVLIWDTGQAVSWSPTRPSIGALTAEVTAMPPHTEPTQGTATAETRLTHWEHRSSHLTCPVCPPRARKQGQQRLSAATHGLTEVHAAWATAGHTSRTTTFASRCSDCALPAMPTGRILGMGLSPVARMLAREAPFDAGLVVGEQHAEMGDGPLVQVGAASMAVVIYTAAGTRAWRCVDPD